MPRRAPVNPVALQRAAVRHVPEWLPLRFGANNTLGPRISQVPADRLLQPLLGAIARVDVFRDGELLHPTAKSKARTALPVSSM